MEIPTWLKNPWLLMVIGCGIVFWNFKFIGLIIGAGLFYAGYKLLKKDAS